MSPFLADTQVQWAWSSTTLGWLKECPRLYYYNAVAGLKPRGESLHLRFGSEYHTTLEHYDRLRADGSSHRNALHEAVRNLLLRTADFRPEATPKTRENLVRTVIWYLEDQAEALHGPTTLRLSDGRPAVELTFKFELEYGPVPDQPYVLTGHLDRIVEFQGITYVMERKTTGSTLHPGYYDQFEPDNQMTLYTLASQIIFGAPVKGVIIDAAQIAVGFSRFGRAITYRTPDQIQEWLTDLHHWLRTAHGYATENYWPMNDKACHKYGGCSFRKVCSKDPSVRDQFLASDYERSTYNPLEIR